MIDTIDVHDLSQVQVRLVKKIVEAFKGGRKVAGRKFASIPSVKADLFLKHSGIFSVGGNAVKEAEYYDE